MNSQELVRPRNDTTGDDTPARNGHHYIDQQWNYLGPCPSPMEAGSVDASDTELGKSLASLKQDLERLKTERSSQ